MTDALKVALDALREALGECDVVRWVENPEAVRELLKHTPWGGASGDQCAECEAEAYDAHFQACPVVNAWRALGDPRAAKDIEWAHSEALTEQVRRQVRVTYRGPAPTVESATATFKSLYGMLTTK